MMRLQKGIDMKASKDLIHGKNSMDCSHDYGLLRVGSIISHHAKSPHSIDEETCSIRQLVGEHRFP